jgi:hypothetical protein
VPVEIRLVTDQLSNFRKCYVDGCSKLYEDAVTNLMRSSSGDRISSVERFRNSWVFASSCFQHLTLCCLISNSFGYTLEHATVIQRNQ